MDELTFKWWTDHRSIDMVTIYVEGHELMSLTRQRAESLSFVLVAALEKRFSKAGNLPTFMCSECVECINNRCVLDPLADLYATDRGITLCKDFEMREDRSFPEAPEQNITEQNHPVNGMWFDPGFKPSSNEV